jgi:hypothetical protein
MKNIEGDKLKRLMNACILGLVLMLSLGGASAYEFGSKVVSGDSDVGLYLDDWNPITDWPRIDWWDCGTVALSFDDGDVLYLDTFPLGIVSTNDVRLTAYGTLAAGTKVATGDNDIGKQLYTASIPTAQHPNIVYVNLYGGPGYDPGDPVYVKTQSAAWPSVAPLATNDVRLTAINGLCAGTTVKDFHSDYGKPVTAFMNNPYSSPTLGPVATIRFYNENGNLQNVAGTPPLYDSVDDVYLDISNAPAGAGIIFGFVVPNDIRLSV